MGTSYKDTLCETHHLFSALISIVVAACGGTEVDPTTTTTTVTTTTTTTTLPVSTTVATTKTTSAPSIVPGQDADVDAIVELYTVVFDSATTYEEKAPLIDNAESLESTVVNYANAGEGVGGIFLEVSVTVDGPSAAVVYDLLFAGNPFVATQDGKAVLNDGLWQVTREFFCSIMDSARVGCPFGG